MTFACKHCTAIFPDLKGLILHIESLESRYQWGPKDG